MRSIRVYGCDGFNFRTGFQIPAVGIKAKGRARASVNHDAGRTRTASHDEIMSKRPENFDTIQSEAACIAKELDLPPCPSILARFTEEARAPQPDLRKLAALIASDIGLSAITLKTVNSPFYGLAQKATSVQQALALLGLRASANLVSGLLLLRAFPAASGSGMERFWAHSIRVARLAGAIALHLKDVDPDEAHTYVLFRDCGMLVMLRKFPQYADIMAQGDRIPGAQLTRVEDARFKFNHARVAYALARSWCLPEPLCGTIFYHHEFAPTVIGSPGVEPPKRNLLAFGLLAEQIAMLHMNRGLCPDWIGAERFVLETLDIEPDAIVALAQDLVAVSV